MSVIEGGMMGPRAPVQLRRDRRAAERAPVARLCHFVDGDHADARRAGGRRAAHGGHDDAGDDGGVGESAPAVAEADASEAEERLAHAAHGHQVPHEKEERNRHERDPRDLREHTLRHEEEARGVAAREEEGRDRGEPHGHGRADAEKHQQEHRPENDEHQHG